MITINDNEDKQKSKYLDSIIRQMNVKKNPKYAKIAKINKE